MSLERPLSADPVAGFPRVSGDEPPPTGRDVTHALFSPRERG